jgi:metallo-beta-lactamase family protein
VKAGPAPVLMFLGATGTVTGSRFLIDTGTARVLVDCGMYQGFKHLRQRNWEPFPFSPAEIDTVVLTHAHLDHSGMLPALVRDGFRGAILSTPQTATLAEIVMRDAGHLQEEEAQYANERGFSKHHPALPLYTEADAERAAQSFDPVSFGTRTQLDPGLAVTLHPAGHILGSSTVLVEVDRPRPRRIVFSGDLGRPRHPVLRPPAPPPAADVVIMESTYGDREHEPIEMAEARLADVITRTARKGGTVVIPSFAVDRTEVLLLALRRMITDGRIPELPVYADSPMALAVLDVYRRAIAEHDPEVGLEASAGVDPFDPGTLHELRTPAQSRSLDRVFPAIIISASGMATGGRVLHHLARCLPDGRCAVVLAGFQAAGTRGRQLADGARTVKLLGRYVPVRAEVCAIDAFSVHADAGELCLWLRSASSPPDIVYLVHGEAEASESLQARVTSDLGWQTVVPKYGERVRLD